MAELNEQVAHLLRRFGLGASRSEVDYYAAAGTYEAAVDRLLDGVNRTDRFAFTANEFRPNKKGKLNMPALSLWWTARLIATDRPAVEKMTLFWHDHFATSGSKVKAAPLMEQQNETLRQHALGNFREMLHAVAKDPAMMVWLDSRENVAGRPNENFARELLELFTLGIGNYSEEDVKETARAFTGGALRPGLAADGQVRATYLFRPRLHDSGTKTILGRTANFTNEEVIELLLSQTRCAEFLVRKMLVWFATPNPTDGWVKRLADGFRRDYEVRPLVKAIAQSSEFAGSDRVVKCPVDFVVSSLRAVGAGAGQPRAIVGAARSMQRMGMRVLFPPDVAGWEGGDAWITSATMVERMKWAKDIATAGAPAIRLLESPEELLALFDAYLAPSRVEIMRSAWAKDTTRESALRVIFAAPEFQMA